MVFNTISIISHKEAIAAIKEARALLPLVIKNLQRPVPKGYEDEIIEHLPASTEEPVVLEKETEKQEYETRSDQSEKKTSRAS